MVLALRDSTRNLHHWASSSAIPARIHHRKRRTQTRSRRVELRRRKEEIAPDSNQRRGEEDDTGSFTEFKAKSSKSEDKSKGTAKKRSESPNRNQGNTLTSSQSLRMPARKPEQRESRVNRTVRSKIQTLTKNRFENQRFASECTTSVNRSKSSLLYNIFSQKTQKMERIEPTEAKPRDSHCSTAKLAFFWMIHA